MTDDDFPLYVEVDISAHLLICRRCGALVDRAYILEHGQFHSLTTRQT